MVLFYERYDFLFTDWVNLDTFTIAPSYEIFMPSYGSYKAFAFVQNAGLVSTENTFFIQNQLQNHFIEFWKSGSWN